MGLSREVIKRDTFWQGLDPPTRLRDAARDATKSKEERSLLPFLMSPLYQGTPLAKPTEMLEA